MHKFPYEWYLKDGYPEKNGLKVFSCFACGGGSTMGYKLAGYEVLGANEIDPKMAECYKENHDPKHLYVEPIQEFKNRHDLPEELFDLDILDGSPPCSSFSMAGNREKDWGKEKKFREGQADQVLDTLFFDFIDLAEKLQPKIVVAENVKGLLMGNAKKYVWEVYQAFDKAGYYLHKWLLNAATMGVPQRRERVFFVAMRKDLANKFESPHKIDLFNPMPHLDMEFDEAEIPFSKCSNDTIKAGEIPNSVGKYYDLMKGFGELSKVHPKGSFFGEIKVHPDRATNTLTSQGKLYHPFFRRRLTSDEFCKIGTFPLDYNFKANKSFYICGMSVPPVMVAQIAMRIKEEWFDLARV